MGHPTWIPSELAECFLRIAEVSVGLFRYFQAVAYFLFFKVFVVFL